MYIIPRQKMVAFPLQLKSVNRQQLGCSALSKACENPWIPIAAFPSRTRLLRWSTHRQEICIDQISRIPFPGALACQTRARSQISSWHTADEYRTLWRNRMPKQRKQLETDQERLVLCSFSKMENQEDPTQEEIDAAYLKRVAGYDDDDAYEERKKTLRKCCTISFRCKVACVLIPAITLGTLYFWFVYEYLFKLQVKPAFEECRKVGNYGSEICVSAFFGNWSIITCFLVFFGCFCGLIAVLIIQLYLGKITSMNEIMGTVEPI